MKILAIETSCDETAIAIAEFTGPRSRPVINTLANLISSQVKLHAKFGGVVPNLAKREHQRNLVPVLLHALKEAKLLKISKSKFLISKQIPKSKIQRLEKTLEREPELLAKFKKNILPLKHPGIDAIAVTIGPGLAPALWVGINFAKALAYLWEKPLIPINHMEGHIFSPLLEQRGKDNFKLLTLTHKFPALALLVSGGHTELVLVRGYKKYKIIGETLDDAAGEAFDKVARLLGFGYPGGPEISKLADKSNQVHEVEPHEVSLPRPMLNSKDYNFSFSGLKTAVLYLTRNLGVKKTRQLRPLIAREFQKAVVEVLVKKTMRAAKEYKIKTILLGGGVAANKLLREHLGKEIKKQLPLASYRLPVTSLTGDNALMIALAAHFQWASLAPKGRAAYFLGMKKAWNRVQADANIHFN